MESLRQKMENGKVLLGTHITNSDIHNVEIMGNCGFDYLWIDMEHTQNTKHEICDILLAARAVRHEIGTFVRVPILDPVLVKPILEMGPTGIIFPMIKTAEDVELAIKSCSYPPKGIRGWSPRAAIGYGLDDVNEYVKTVDRKIWKLIQIETKEAYDNIDELLKNTDVDVFILGPCDFSGAFGCLPDYKCAKVMDKIDIVFKKVKSAGRKIGVSIGPYDYDNISLWMKKGVDMISVGSEVSFMLDGSLRALENLRKAYADTHR